MGLQTENRWEYEAVSINGNPSKALVTRISSESISDYATRVRNNGERYHQGADTSMPIPVQIFRFARLRRQDIALANDHVALEWVSNDSRQTPFAKCAMRWNRVIRAGENITSFSWVVDKYERRGNKFVTFRVNALDESGNLVAEYDYTSIFEYGAGQKERIRVADETPVHVWSADTESIAPRFDGDVPPLDLNTLSVGDKLPELVVGESQATIDGTRFEDGVNESPPQNIHNDPKFASRGIFAGTVNGGVTTMSYIVQMLEPWFPIEGLYNGGSLEFKAINPFRPGDIVKFSGTISEKVKTTGFTRIACQIKGETSTGELIGVATAGYNLH